MLRRDKVTVLREIYDKTSGEAIYKDPVVIRENIPCHLSLVSAPTDKLNGAPCLFSSFTLFLNTSENADIKENDILQVTTAKNQHYKLFAGSIRIYDLTTQIECRQEKIIES